MIDNFEKLREKLHESIKKKGINAKETMKISEKFDELVNSYYLHQKQYNEDNIMYKAFDRSIRELRKITREFGEFPSVNGWNQYAKDKGLLSSESLKYISGTNWNILRNRILSEI